MEPIMLYQIEIALKKMRSTKPIILNLTNYVTMDFMANSLLALGCAPIMTICNEELEELIKISSSININIGTLDNSFIKRCNLAIDIAATYKKPIVLDPVGAGASLIRTKISSNAINSVAILKGNASEIMALAGYNSNTLGVESTKTTLEAKEAAIELAQQYGITTVISGPIDFITDGKKEAEISFGSPLMSLVTGMGCTLTAVIASFRSVLNDSPACRYAR